MKHRLLMACVVLGACGLPKKQGPAYAPPAPTVTAQPENTGQGAQERKEETIETTVTTTTGESGPPESANQDPPKPNDTPTLPPPVVPTVRIVPMFINSTAWWKNCLKVALNAGPRSTSAATRERERRRSRPKAKRPT